MRLLTLLTPALAALTLAACEEQSVVEAGAPALGTDAGEAVEPSRMLGDVDISGDVQLNGTEPFWSVVLAGPEMIYEGLDRPEQRAPRPEPVVQGTTATWTSETTQGSPLTVTLMETECSDGMSDRIYPLTARVEISGEVLNGCAASTQWFETTGEDGQPREG